MQAGNSIVLRDVCSYVTDMSRLKRGHFVTGFQTAFKRELFIKARRKRRGCACNLCISRNAYCTANEIPRSKKLSHQKKEQAGNFAGDTRSNMVDFVAVDYKNCYQNESSTGSPRK